MEKHLAYRLMVKAILQECIDGNRNAQRKLYEYYYPTMMGVCNRYATDRDEAAFILNNGFFKVFKHLKKFDAEVGNLEAWIRRIMINTAIDHFRRNSRRQRTMDVDTAYPMQQESSSVVAELNAEDILKLVQQLTPAYRASFNLYVVEGYSHKEVAKKLGISEGTSKSNLAKARGKLKQMLEKSSKAKTESYVGTNR